jgi:N-acetylmuramoyl-L-alanine amidase
MQNKSNYVLLIILGFVALVTGICFFLQKEQIIIKTSPRYKISPLSREPQWEKLNVYQKTITRDNFVSDLEKIFTVSDTWKNFIIIKNDHALIKKMTTNESDYFRLDFANLGQEIETPKMWKRSIELGLFDKQKPLKGLHIAIDPGHLGGDWAQMEERWFMIDEGIPVVEGDMTLYVARLLEKKLNQYGAKVSLVRSKNEPLTKDRPESLIDMIKQAQTNQPPMSPFALAKASEQLFYRTSEIRARAAVVNDVLKPDLVLCLHFNAVEWGDPNQPTLVDENHFHLLFNGAYTDEEITYDDQRFEMIYQLLQRTSREEFNLGAVMAEAFSEESKLPAYNYGANSSRAKNIDNNPYLWARNLLANRVYHCPVIYFEPYVMNSSEVYERIQMGDYFGNMMFRGQLRKSIFQEYADGVTAGLLQYYQMLHIKK